MTGPQWGEPYELVPRMTAPWSSSRLITTHDLAGHPRGPPAQPPRRRRRGHCEPRAVHSFSRAPLYRPFVVLHFCTQTNGECMKTTSPPRHGAIGIASRAVDPAANTDAREHTSLRDSSAGRCIILGAAIQFISSHRVSGLYGEPVNEIYTYY
jgi:hypothetical protein